MTADLQPAYPATTVRGVRRAMIVLVVASLVVASLLGIAVLLGGEFGDTQGRIVLTTLVVAAFGTTALCHLAVVTRPVRVTGFCGLVASVGAAGYALVLVWWDRMPEDDAWWKTLTVLAVAAVSLAHANLLLLLAGRTHPVLRAGLLVTLAAIAVVAVMLVVPVLTDGTVPGTDDEWYWRWFGVAGIVDALGTVALPVLGLVLAPREPSGGAEPVPGPGRGSAPETGEEAGRDAGAVRLVLDLPAELAARLDTHAGGGSRGNAALDVLHRGLPPG